MENAHSLEVNQSALICSFFSGFRHTDRFYGNGHKLSKFSFRKSANSKFTTKTTKRNRINVSLFTKKPHKWLIFYWANNLKIWKRCRNWNRHRRKSGGHRRFLKIDQCPYTRIFLNDFESYWCLLSINRFVCHCRMLYLVSYLSNALN